MTQEKLMQEVELLHPSSHMTDGAKWRIVAMVLRVLLLRTMPR